jgi:hypothetical protein
MIMFTKIVATIFSFFFKLLLGTLAILVITPLALFAWRASQPMYSQEFRAMSFFHLLAERQAAYAELATKYQASHPNVDVKPGMCFGVEVFVEFAVSLPGSGFYTLAGLYPDLQRYVNPLDVQRGYIPDNVTYANFLTTWWDTFELFIWQLIKHAPHGPVAYCRIAVP